MAAKKKAPTLAAGDIDPRGGDVVLVYVEDAPTPRFVPHRDLRGADLAKIAYQRALTEQVNNRPVLVAPGETLPEPHRPAKATATELAELAAELVASKAFKPAIAPAPTEA